MQILAVLHTQAVAQQAKEPIPPRAERFEASAAVPGVRDPVPRRKKWRQVSSRHGRIPERCSVNPLVRRAIRQPSVTRASVELHVPVKEWNEIVAYASGELTHL